MPTVKKDILWTLSSNILPLLTALILIPNLISQYGTERFGLITIAWALVGYFGLFDMGLSRAMTHLLSKNSTSNNTTQNSEIAFTGLNIMWLIGAFSTIALCFALGWLVDTVFNPSLELKSETLLGFTILITCIPFVVHTAGLKGIMDALRLFKTSSIIRMVFATGMFLFPYFAGLIEANLINAMISIVILRVIVWLMHYIAVKRTKIIKPKSNFSKVQLKALLSFGGWVAVSNVIGPLMVYIDRFIISSLLGASIVAYYVAPYEVVTKLWVFPLGFTTVLFPLFAREWEQNAFYTAEVLSKGTRYLLILITPMCIIVAFTSTEWLQWWLGNKFSVASASIVTWLSAGIVMNCLAQIIFAYIQGTGRSDLTAKLHLIELLPYWLLLWYLMSKYQLNGAAIAWFIRCSFDCIGLAFLAIKINNINKNPIVLSIILGILSVTCILVSLMIEQLSMKIIFATTLLFVISLYGLCTIKADRILEHILKNR